MVKNLNYQIPVLIILLLLVARCGHPAGQVSEFSSVSRIDSGKAFSVMLTAYSTTLIANGKDQTPLRIAITDSLSREIISATDTVHLYVSGDARAYSPEGKELVYRKDSSDVEYAICPLKDGVYCLLLRAGKTPGKIKIEARSGKLWPGSHEIHTLPESFVNLKPNKNQIPQTNKKIDRMIGADISFLPQLEDRGILFRENGQETDAISLLRRHGFNYIRLRIFVQPENPKGYAPGKGYCDLFHTLAMAKRIKNAGMKLLLDFHYSDYWADPQQQNKPLRWEGMGIEALTDSVKSYTAYVLQTLKEQGTSADMVQIGNEINHGLLWPDGHISNPDQLALLLKAGTEGAEAVDPSLPVMMHLALGGQNKEAVFWLDNMIARGVKFDLIGLSYYPRWHGTLDDLNKNLRNLAKRYKKPLIIAEYSDFKKEVHDIVFQLPDELGKGACIWEPLNFWSGLFTRNNEATNRFAIYDSLAIKYLK